MFRTQYLDYAALTAQLQTWASQYPSFVKLESIGKSREGRDVHLLTIGTSPDEVRPAVWVDGNMHASEFCGSSVALAIAEDLITIHAGMKGVAQLPAHMAELVKSHLFYIVPRIAPDGAEAVLKTGRYIRSDATDRRADQGRSYWQNADVDDDGQIGYMRQQHPNGEMVELNEAPGVLVARQPEDAGPFYRVFPEGNIANFSGGRIPDPDFLGDTQTDYNRNFPYQWGAENEQQGAGEFPGSEPEIRALLEFHATHPNIFAWINYHTFGGVFLRPSHDIADNQMDQADLAVFKQVEIWAKELTGYPMVSGFHDFQYVPGVPSRGVITGYAYHQRGALSYCVELWDIFTQIGVEKKTRFVDFYSQLERKDLIALAKWDSEVNQSRIFQPWRKFDHPQLGPVELGGFDMRVGISNPPYEKLDEVCRQHSATTLRVASLLPSISLDVTAMESIAPGVTRVELRVSNAGYLGSHGISSAKKLAHVEPLRLTADGDGVTLATQADAVTQLGHLDGWGQGPHGGYMIALPWTRGSGNERSVSLVVTGKGQLRVKVGSCRVGFKTLTIEVR
ncbi:MAG: M14 family metallopeptidase [Betaproteobacteria bacterium]